ncbi:MAG: hypothetical protein PWP45_1614 [Tepidanaerobacteraceae bacterium]|nr:hypothetical protein [Tepidanaerobacteraceae bacterium]
MSNAKKFAHDAKFFGNSSRNRLKSYDFLTGMKIAEFLVDINCIIMDYGERW